MPTSWMDGRSGYLACWQSEFEEEARCAALAGEVSPEDNEDPTPLLVGEDHDDENVVDARQAVAVARARVIDAGEAVVAPRHSQCGCRLRCRCTCQACAGSKV